MRNRILAILIVLSLVPAARADALHVAGAGSLTSAFTDLLRRFPAGPDIVAVPEFGPSGLMREKIEAGADIDLFASADMLQARRLAVGHPERFVVNFTRNRLCAIARVPLGLTSANMLDRLLDPAVRLATSTPGADPAGDYAWAVFARAESMHPGARAALEAKAQQLYGGGAKIPNLVPGKGAIEGIFLANRADVAIGYCSGAADIVHEVPGLVVVPLPPELAVGPAYGMVVLDAKPVAYRFAMFVMSERGQAILKEHGFDPVALVGPASPSPELLIQVAGAPARSVSPEWIAGLPHLTQRVGFVTGRGEQQNEWSGPSPVGCPGRFRRGRSLEAGGSGSHRRSRHRRGRIHGRRRPRGNRAAVRRPADTNRRRHERRPVATAGIASDRPRRSARRPVSARCRSHRHRLNQETAAVALAPSQPKCVIYVAL
jgi:ABC-type molybdate transport system substrate-binding protein